MRAAVRGIRRIRGITLIELMVSMVLGLVVIGGATGVIIANRESYRANEALSQVQESARTAFELLARDVRQAGLSGCNSNSTARMANVLRTGTAWWQNWFGIEGFEGSEADGAIAVGTAVAQRVSGTDSMLLQSIEGTGLSVESHNPISANIKLSMATTSIVDDDILIICDFDHATIFQVAQYNSANVTLVHNTGERSPGNCSNGLGYPTQCGNPGNSYAFGPNSQVARLAAVDWYIGNNGRPAEGGRSLYRRRMGAGAALSTEEVVAGVSDMQILYREAGSATFVPANAVGTWTNVNAVMIELTMLSADQRVSTDTSVNSGRLRRTFRNVVTLRNRVP